jgi:hypothetical protein
VCNNNRFSEQKKRSRSRQNNTARSLKAHRAGTQQPLDDKPPPRAFRKLIAADAEFWDIQSLILVMTFEL